MLYYRNQWSLKWDVHILELLPINSVLLTFLRKKMYESEYLV